MLCLPPLALQAGTDNVSLPSTQQSDGVWQCPATVLHRCIGQGQIWGHAMSLMLVGCSELPPCSLAGSSFTLAWAAKDQGELRRFLMQNLSLPNSTAELLLGSSIDLREVGDLWALQVSVLPCEWHPTGICPTLPPHTRACWASRCSTGAPLLAYLAVLLLPRCRCTSSFLIPFLSYLMRPMSKTCGMGLAPARG